MPSDSLKFQSLDEAPLVAMYVWPLVCIVVRKVVLSSGAIASAAIAEAIIGGTVLWGVLKTIGLWGSVRYGGVILVSALLAYLLAIAVTLYGCVREPRDSSPR